MNGTNPKAFNGQPLHDLAAFLQQQLMDNPYNHWVAEEGRYVFVGDSHLGKLVPMPDGLDYEDDSLHGTDSNDRIEGLTGDDFLSGGRGDDIINGGIGNDGALGGFGNDTIRGDEGNDILMGGYGRDVIDGGSGDDLIVGFQEEATFYMSLQRKTFGALDPNAYDQESSGNVLKGGTGNDTIKGSDGDDVIDGGADNDKLLGGSGDDTIQGGTGNDEIKAGRGDDVIDGGTGGDFIYAGAGNDSAEGGSGNDQLYGDVRLVEDPAGGHVEGNDVLRGGAGNDRIYGDGADDQLFGDSGADTLEGGSGNDVLSGGLGLDDLTGGLGSDVFLFDTTLTAPSVATIMTPVVTAGSNSGLGNAGLVGPTGSSGGVLQSPTATLETTGRLVSYDLDTIRDFNAAEDTIQLSQNVFRALGTGPMSAFAFHVGDKAQDALDRIIYNKDTGALLYDADGSGSGVAIEFATILGGVQLTASDFLII
jgi:Ca2+-binding RTX toxin-like protein